MNNILDDINFEDDRKEGQPKLLLTSKLIFGLNALLFIAFFISVVLETANISFSIFYFIPLLVFILFPIVGIVAFIAEWSRAQFFTQAFSHQDKWLMIFPPLNLTCATLMMFL